MQPVLLLALALLVSALPGFGGTSVPFSHRGGLLWVNVQFEGQAPAKFLVDSGAGATILDQRLARRLGLREGKQQWVRGTSGLAPAFAVRGISGTVGGCPIPQSALALDLSGIGHGEQIDGLLGVDFFEDRIVEIDYAAQRLRILDRSELPQNPHQTLSVARRNDALCIQVSIGGEKPSLMRLDTGCNSALEWVTPSRARQGNRSAAMYVQLGSLRMAGIKTGLHAQPMFAGERGLVGNGLLSKWRVTFDLEKNRVFLN